MTESGIRGKTQAQCMLFGKVNLKWSCAKKYKWKEHFVDSARKAVVNGFSKMLYAELLQKKTWEVTFDITGKENIFILKVACLRNETPTCNLRAFKHNEHFIVSLEVWGLVECNLNPAPS